MNFPAYVTSSQASTIYKRRVRNETRQSVNNTNDLLTESVKIMQLALPKLNRRGKRFAVPVEIKGRTKLNRDTLVGGWIIGEQHLDDHEYTGVEQNLTSVITEDGIIYSGWFELRENLRILIVSKHQRNRRSIIGNSHINVAKKFLGGADGCAMYVMIRPELVKSKLNSYLS